MKLRGKAKAGIGKYTHVLMSIKQVVAVELVPKQHGLQLKLEQMRSPTLSWS